MDLMFVIITLNQKTKVLNFQYYKLYFSWFFFFSSCELKTKTFVLYIFYTQILFLSYLSPTPIPTPTPLLLLKLQEEEKGVFLVTLVLKYILKKDGKNVIFGVFN